MTTRTRLAKIGKEELERRLADGTAYFDVVVKGKWQYRKTGISTCVIECSECEYALCRGNSDPDLDRFIRETQAMIAAKGLTLDKFCPNCGADMQETAPTKSVLDEVAGELEELEKTEPFAYGDTKIRMGVGLGIMKARKIIDNYREEGDEGIEEGITTFVEGKYDPIYIGYNSHDCEAMYKCPECGEVHGDWEWVGKREFTCTCGATWNVPK